MKVVKWFGTIFGFAIIAIVIAFVMSKKNNGVLYSVVFNLYS